MTSTPPVSDPVSDPVRRATTLPNTANVTPYPVPRRRRAVFIASSYAPREPRHPRALPYAITEAYQMWSFMQAHYPFDECVQDTAPSRASILAHLDDAVRDARPGDLFLITFTGHGASLPAAAGTDELDGRTEAMVPDGATSPADMVTDREVRARLDRLPAGVHAILVFDCCHSATMCNLRHVVEAATQDGLFALTRWPVAETAAHIVCISAAQDAQIAYDSPRARGGVLGTALRAWLDPRQRLLAAPTASTYADLLSGVCAGVRNVMREMELDDGVARTVPSIAVSFSRAVQALGTAADAPLLDALLRQTPALLPPYLSPHAARVRQRCPTPDDVYQYFHTEWMADGSRVVGSNTVDLALRPGRTVLRDAGISPSCGAELVDLDPWYVVTARDDAGVELATLSLPRPTAPTMTRVPSRASTLDIDPSPALTQRTAPHPATLTYDATAAPPPDDAIVALYSQAGYQGTSYVAHTEQEVDREALLRVGIVDGVRSVRVAPGWRVSVSGSGAMCVGAGMMLHGSLADMQETVPFRVHNVRVCATDLVYGSQDVLQVCELLGAARRAVDGRGGAAVQVANSAAAGQGAGGVRLPPSLSPRRAADGQVIFMRFQVWRSPTSGSTGTLRLVFAPSDPSDAAAARVVRRAEIGALEMVIDMRAHDGARGTAAGAPLPPHMVMVGAVAPAVLAGTLGTSYVPPQHRWPPVAQRGAWVTVAIQIHMAQRAWKLSVRPDAMPLCVERSHMMPTSMAAAAADSGGSGGRPEGMIALLGHDGRIAIRGMRIATRPPTPFMRVAAVRT